MQRGWVAYALCADDPNPEDWFPENGEANRRAEGICEQCLVRSDCLMISLLNEEQWGIWGALGERERRRLMGQRGKAKINRIEIVDWDAA